MEKVVAAAAMREIDRLTTERYGVPSICLMETAAMRVASAIESKFDGGITGRSVLIFCGPGNNGGDGAAIARILAMRGGRVRIVLLTRIESTSGDARTNFEIIRQIADEVSEIQTPQSVFLDLKRIEDSHGSILLNVCESADELKQTISLPVSPIPDVTIDAIFGTGLTRPVSGVFEAAVALINVAREAHTGRSNSPLIVAVDIPSGLNSDLAESIGPAVQADMTVTFTAPKPACVLQPACAACGELVVAEIGSPTELVEEAMSELFLVEREDVLAWLTRTRFTPESYKNTHGHVLVIAGSRGMTGAAVLTGGAALRSGAGLVTIATPSSSQPIVATKAMDELMTVALAETDRGAVSDEAIDHVVKLMDRSTVVAIGPGLTSDDERTRRFVRGIVDRRSTPVVVDADGLNALSPWPGDLRGSVSLPIIVTPHPGEMRRLSGVDSDAMFDRVAIAREFASTHHLIVVLKGSRSLIASPDGRVFVNPTGNAGLGTAGAGDTLTGVIAGFLAQEFAGFGASSDQLGAVIAAIYLAGLAGDIAAAKRGMRSMIASDVREHLGEAFMQIDPLGERP